MKKISFVILNYKRPKNLTDHIIPSLLKNEFVDKIIISHALEETYFNNSLNSEKLLCLKHFKENKKSGLYCRFLASEKAKTECVVFQDDDFLIDNKSINFCYEQWLKNKHSIHGFRGRQITECLYVAKDTSFKNVPVVLTQFAMTSKSIVRKTIRTSSVLKSYMRECNPIWNGEDIFLSLISILQTKEFNKIHDLKFKKMSSEYAISKRSGHYEHRTNIVKKMFELFPDLKNIFKSNSINVS